jgi:hypothetical protein
MISFVGAHYNLCIVESLNWYSVFYVGKTPPEVFDI